jgi:3-dehydroquinate synthase
VTSPEIWKLWGERLQSGFPAPLTVLSVPAGEQHKRMATVERLLEELAAAGADRDSILIAFGGGVIGDMTGFLAATYMRGIRYVQVPTTALAQIDSAIGGKTGVNLAAGKNLAGAFYPPLAVYSDIDVLQTLPAAELRAGLQEAVKAGIIRDRALFDFMESGSAAVLAGDAAALTRVIADSVRMKAAVVSADEREGGLRMILNLGHTLGHAIEAATGYSQLLHGEAVAWGMLAAVAIAKRRGLVTAAEHDRVEHVVKIYGPLKRFQAEAAQLVALTAKDKKNRSGSRSFVLPRGIGDAVVVKDVTVEELTLTAERMMAMVAREGAA